MPTHHWRNSAYAPTSHPLAPTSPASPTDYTLPQTSRYKLTERLQTAVEKKWKKPLRGYTAYPQAALRLHMGTAARKSLEEAPLR